MERIIAACFAFLLMLVLCFSMSGCTVSVDGVGVGVDVGFDISVTPSFEAPSKPNESYDGNLSSLGLGLTSDSTMSVYSYGRGFKVDFEVGLKSDKTSIRTVQKSLANWLISELDVDRDDVTIRIGSPSRTSNGKYKFYIIIQFNREGYPYYDYTR